MRRAEDAGSRAGPSPLLSTRSGFLVSFSIGRGVRARDAEEPVESLTSERGFVEAALEQLRSEWCMAVPGTLRYFYFQNASSRLVKAGKAL